MLTKYARIVSNQANTHDINIAHGTWSCNMSEDKRLDATGLFCPEPVFRTKIEIERMQVGQILAVTADDPAAEEDISRWVQRQGHKLLETKKDGSVVEISIQKVK